MPLTTTPAETSVSASMCRNAPRVLISCCLRESIHAVSPFTNMATTAVQVTNAPLTSAGCENLRTLSTAIPPTATNNIMAFSNEISTELFLYPYVYRFVAWVCDSFSATIASSRQNTSLRLCPASDSSPIECPTMPATVSAPTKSKFITMATTYIFPISPAGT